MADIPGSSLRKLLRTYLRGSCVGGIFMCVLLAQLTGPVIDAILFLIALLCVWAFWKLH